MDSVVAAAPDVVGHHGVGVTGSNMDLSGEHPLDVILGSLKNGRERHDKSEREGG